MSPIREPEKAFQKQISITPDLLKTTERHHEPGARADFESGQQFEYTSGRDASIELVSRRTASPLDPLNWPRWKKELAYSSFVFLAVTIGSLKSILAPVNAVIATEFTISYLAASSLTGVPIILGAFLGVTSNALSQVTGKRALLLSGSVCMFIGSMWNMYVKDVYAEFMVARSFQGVGWGILEGLIVDSINDLFLGRQLDRRMNIYRFVSIASIWGGPIVGGYISQSEMGWRTQFMVASIIQAVSVLLLLFATPETGFDRSDEAVVEDGTKATAFSTFAISPFKTYLYSLRLVSPSGASKTALGVTLAPFKAMGAPSTILTALYTAPLLATAFGTAQSTSLIFSSMPTFLFPEKLGYLFILPLSISIVLLSITAAATHFYERPSKFQQGPTKSKDLSLMISTIFGVLLGIGGLLGFGLYTVMELSSNVPDEGQMAILGFDPEGQDISLEIVSALFGLLVGGAVMLSFTGTRRLSLSSSAPSGETSELETGHRALQEILIGIFIVSFPAWLKSPDRTLAGLRVAAIALAVVVPVVSGTAAILMWVKRDVWRRIDDRIVGRKQTSVPLLQTWKTGASFQS